MEEQENSEGKKMEQRKNKLNNFLFGWVKDNYDKAFLGVLALALIIRIYFFIITKTQPVWWDAADYLSLAKVFGKGLRLDYLFSPRRPFLLSLIWAFFFKIGLDEISLRILQVLFSMGALVGMYMVGKSMFNKKIALISSCLFAVFWQDLFFSYRMMTEIPDLFFFLFALYFFWEGYIKKRKNMLIWFGVFLGCAVLTRAATLMMGFSFAIFIIIHDKWRFVKNKELWKAVLIVLLFLSSFLFFIYVKEQSNPINRFLGIGERRFNSTNSMKFAGIITYSAFFPQYLGWALLIPFLLGLGMLLLDLILNIDLVWKAKNEKLQTELFLFLLFLVPFFYHAYIGDHFEDRYLMLCFIPFFMILSDALLKVYEWIKPHGKQLAIGAIIAILLLGAYFQLNMANTTIINKSTSYAPVKDAGLWLKENTLPNETVMTRSYYQNFYYSERETYKISSTNETDFIKELKDKKPDYFILSVFEQYPDFLYSFPQEHPEIMTPIKVYNQGDQPLLIIYKVNNSFYEQQTSTIENTTIQNA
jgi:4-amino-4-deoxy-L-arabinose transferase-like glycosyltransferase